MHNLRTVIDFEFFRTLKKRSFWLSVLAFPVLIVLIGLISYVSNSAANDAGDVASAQSFTLVVLDESGLVSDEALRQFGAGTAASREAGIEQVRSGQIEGFIYYPPDPATAPVEVYGQDQGITGNGRYEAAAEQMLTQSVLASVPTDEQRAILRDGVNTDVQTFENGEPAAGFYGMIAPGLFLILFYILIILLGSQMLNSTTEEKENRVIEMMLTTIRARSIIVGKIIALLLLGIVQIVAILVPILIASVVFGDVINIPDFDFSAIVFDPGRIIAGAALFALSFLMFTGVLVTISSSVPTAKEAGSFFGFSMFAIFAPLYAVAAIISDPGQVIVKVFSFVPLTAPVTLMLRNAAGNLGGFELALGLVILAASAVLALGAAVRAFRRGTLMYDRRLTFKEIVGLS